MGGCFTAIQILFQFIEEGIPHMFCYQCEQTYRGQCCVDLGVCGKNEIVGTLQDLLVHAIEGIATYAHRARRAGAIEAAIDEFVIDGLFATGTNVNFDPQRIKGLIDSAIEVRDRARRMCEQTGGAGNPVGALQGAAVWKPAKSLDGLLAQGRESLLLEKRLVASPEVGNLQELILYGVKGLAAYLAHAKRLGVSDAAANGTLLEILDFLTWPAPTLDEQVAVALKTGELNYRVLQLLDRANTDAFGHPQPAKVRLHPRAGKAILVSGHDLADLYDVLRSTEGTGIQVYTHGEMLPAHGYPKLKAFPHLAGNYGGGWQDQGKEFPEFPGAIVVTSNCIQEPKKCAERVFTTGPTAWPGVRHIENHDYSPVVEAALGASGYDNDGADDQITVGFGHQAVLGVAGKLVEAVKAGAIRHFFLIGGCDGARPGRNYYTEFAQTVPNDCVILTLACGKYRFNKLDFGEIGGLPRLLDLGQCNDAYSALQIADALAGAFECGINGLPLSLVLSWYEQKAVAILLTLLHLGVRNIRLGPTLPAFITPAVLGLLQEKFNLMPITSPERDLAAILN
jgi:hydroxylamine reductase